MALIYRPRLAPTIHEMAESGDLKSLQHFLNSETGNIHEKNSHSQTPLHLTSWWEVAETLIARGADAHARDKTGRTPLHTAAFEGRKEIVKSLIPHCTDINAQDPRTFPKLTRDQHFAVKGSLMIKMVQRELSIELQTTRNSKVESSFQPRQNLF